MTPPRQSTQVAHSIRARKSRYPLALTALLASLSFVLADTTVAQETESPAAEREIEAAIERAEQAAAEARRRVERLRAEQTALAKEREAAAARQAAIEAAQAERAAQAAIEAAEAERAARALIEAAEAERAAQAVRAAEAARAAEAERAAETARAASAARAAAAARAAEEAEAALPVESDWIDDGGQRLEWEWVEEADPPGRAADAEAAEAARRAAEQAREEELRDAIEQAQHAADEAQATADEARAIAMALRQEAVAHRNRYARTGFYLGVAGVYAPENFDGTRDLDVDNSWGLAGFAGYRVHRHVAVELRGEVLKGFDVTGDATATLPAVDAEIDGFLVTVGPKFYALTGSIQPFVGLSVGAFHAEIDGRRSDGTRIGDRATEALIRPAIGIDAYVSENLALNLEAAYVAPGGDTEDISFGVLSAGLSFRF